MVAATLYCSNLPVTVSLGALKNRSIDCCNALSGSAFIAITPAANRTIRMGAVCFSLNYISRTTITSRDTKLRRRAERE